MKRAIIQNDSAMGKDLKEILRELGEVEIEIHTSDSEGIEMLKEFETSHLNESVIEETDSADGLEIVSLIIEKLPSIITSIAGLVTALKAKGIVYTLKNKENGKNIEEN